MCIQGMVIWDVTLQFIIDRYQLLQESAATITRVQVNRAQMW
jgi:hypothetical protein